MRPLTPTTPDLQSSMTVVVLCYGADLRLMWTCCSKESYEIMKEERRISPNSSGKPKFINRRLALG